LKTGHLKSVKRGHLVSVLTRLSGLEGEEALEVALQYGLLCEQTSYLLVKEREEKSGELPQLRKVPHALAAGWGGLDVLHSPGVVLCENLVCFDAGHHGQVPGFEDDLPFTDPENWEKEFLAPLERACNQRQMTSLPVISIRGLERLGVPREVLGPLRALIDEGHEERLVVVAWLRSFLESLDEWEVPRNLRRLVRRTARQVGLPEELYEGG